MSSFVRMSDLPSREMVAKLINAGYLKPAQCNDADAITNAIARMKENLRGGGRQLATTTLLETRHLGLSSGPAAEYRTLTPS